MDTAALVISIFAVLLTVVVAGFGILIQFLTHKATTEQSERVAASVGQFRTDMQGLVSELKGMTDALVHAQQQQFNRMLDAFVTRPEAASEAAEKASESAGIADELRSEFESLREEIGSAGGTDAVVAALDRVRERLEEVHRTAEQAAQSAQVAAKGGGDRAVADRPGQNVYVEGVGAYEADVLKLLALLELSGGERFSAGFGRLVARRIYKSARRLGLVEAVQAEGGPAIVRLTDEGRRVAQAYGRSVAVAH
jgi:hypothetical protein